MILAETTVAVSYLRNPSPRLLQIIQANQAALCGVTTAEVYAGARTVADLAHYSAILSVFGNVPTLEGIWSALGQNLFALRTNGITVAFPDALIATVAIQNDLELWTYDGHFSLMQSVLPRLKLFQEPP